MTNLVAIMTVSWDVLVPVIASVNTNWNVGPPQNTHIRQLAQERIDFIY